MHVTAVCATHPASPELLILCTARTCCVAQALVHLHIHLTGEAGDALVLPRGITIHTNKVRPASCVVSLTVFG